MSLFDHIIDRKIPATFVHEDELCVAFMDIRPMSRGHVLVVPRQSRAHLAELDAPVRAHLWEAAGRIALAQQRGLGSGAQHFLVNDGKVASQSVPHVHIHVIPRYRGDGMATALRMISHLVLLHRPPSVTPKLRQRLEVEAAAIRAALLLSSASPATRPPPA